MFKMSSNLTYFDESLDFKISHIIEYTYIVGLDTLCHLKKNRLCTLHLNYLLFLVEYKDE